MQAPPSADEPWHLADSIPVGTVSLCLEACSPITVELGPCGAHLVFLTSEQLQLLAAHDAGDVVSHLQVLQSHNAAWIAMEQDALTLWAAGMYAGHVHLRVVARVHDVAKPATFSAWRAVLSLTCIDDWAWSATSRDTDGPVQGTPFWDPLMVRALPYADVRITRVAVPATAEPTTG